MLPNYRPYCGEKKRSAQGLHMPGVKDAWRAAKFASARTIENAEAKFAQKRAIAMPRCISGCWA